MAEALLDVLEIHRRVLDHVVEERRAGERGVETLAEEIEQHAAHLDHVRDVGLVRFAPLRTVGGRREVEARPDAMSVDLGRALLELGQQRGAQLRVGDRRAHGAISPRSLSWMCVSPIHSLRCGR